MDDEVEGDCTVMNTDLRIVKALSWSFVMICSLRMTSKNSGQTGRDAPVP